MLPRPVENKVRKKKAICLGIISKDGCMENCIKLRINAASKDATSIQNKAIAYAYGNKFIIPLDFEMEQTMLRAYFQQLQPSYQT